MRVRSVIAAAVALQAIEKIFFHDIEVLKHGAFRLGRVALLDRLQYLFVPAPGKLMARCAHVFDFCGVEEFPIKRQTEKHISARLVDLYERGIVGGFDQRVVEHAVGIKSRGVTHPFGLDEDERRRIVERALVMLETDVEPNTVWEVE